MKFINDHHKNFFEEILQADGMGNDPERRALFYILGFSPSIRFHIWDLYDVRERSINIEGLNASWQTSETKNLTRFAFNLYNNFQGEEAQDESTAYYTPHALFGGPYTEFMLEAVRVRYP